MKTILKFILCLLLVFLVNMLLLCVIVLITKHLVGVI